MTSSINRRRMIIRTASAMAAGACSTSIDSKTSYALPFKENTRAVKLQAMNDYSKSLEAFGGQLRSPIEQLLNSSATSLPWQFDAVVIGSGYGASVCAARLASKMRPGAKLAVIERGKEWIPGTFGDNFRKIGKESRKAIFGLDSRTIRNPTGMVNLVQGKDVNVFSASGLGGTSLINANVAIRPDRDLFHQSPWSGYIADRAFLDPYFDRAEWELGVQREPIDLTDKMRAQRLAAERLRDEGAHFEASALTITRSPHLGLPIINRQGMIQRPCTSCGDCMTGCNVGAKNSLAMNYLPLARKNGAMLFTETEIERIEKHQDHYLIHYVHYVHDGIQFVPIRGCVTSRIVIVGAGSLGSTEILLRSESPNMQFTSTLGCNWSGNGDILGFIRGVEPCTSIAGTGATDFVEKLIGPTIQSNVTYPHRSHIHDRVIIQEGVSASAYNMFVALFGRDIGLDHTQVLLVSGHDGGQGRIELDEDGRAAVRWPGMYDIPYRKFAENELRRFAAALGGEYRELTAFKGRVGTVHPLGGCGIGADPKHGVINHKGQVYDGSHGGDIDPHTNEYRVHQGLYVADGSTMPAAIGVNPLLTISAVAERTADLLTREPRYADLFVA